MGVAVEMTDLEGYYAQAAVSPGGRWVVATHVRCCAVCNEGMAFVAGRAIGALVELWDTRSGMRVDAVPFEVLYPGVQRVELRWTRKDTLAVVVGDTSALNDAPQVHSFRIVNDGAGRLRRVDSVYVSVAVPVVDLFGEEAEELEMDELEPLPQLVQIRRDWYGDHLGGWGEEEEDGEVDVDYEGAGQTGGEAAGTVAVDWYPGDGSDVAAIPDEKEASGHGVEEYASSGTECADECDAWPQEAFSTMSSAVSSPASPSSLGVETRIALPVSQSSTETSPAPHRKSRSRTSETVATSDGAIASRTATVVMDERICRMEATTLHTSMDGRILLFSDAGTNYACTYDVDAVPPDEMGSPSGGTHPQKTAPLATFPARRNNACCFLSPCGTYVAVVTSVFATEDLQEGMTEKLTIAMHRADGSREMYSVTFEMHISGDFRPGEWEKPFVGGMPTRGEYKNAFFNDGSDSVCDTFVVPMSDDELPVVMTVETGEVLCLPPLSDRTIESIANCEEVPLFRYTLNEELFLTFFSTQSGPEHCDVQVYDCIAKEKLICTLQTPSNHRWRCEAHASGFVFVENNCVCCSSALLLPIGEQVADEDLISPEQVEEPELSSVL